MQRTTSKSMVRCRSEDLTMAMTRLNDNLKIQFLYSQWRSLYEFVCNIVESNNFKYNRELCLNTRFELQNTSSPNNCDHLLIYPKDVEVYTFLSYLHASKIFLFLHFLTFWCLNWKHYLPSCCCCCSSKAALLSAFLFDILLHATSCSCLLILSQLSILRVVPSALIITGPISSKEIVSPNWIFGIDGSSLLLSGRRSGPSFWLSLFTLLSTLLLEPPSAASEDAACTSLFFVQELSVDMADALGSRWLMNGINALPKWTVIVSNRVRRKLWRWYCCLGCNNCLGARCSWRLLMMDFGFRFDWGWRRREGDFHFSLKC